MPSAASASQPGYAALLRRPGYLGFVVTVLITRVSTSMFLTTGVLIVLVRTHSAALAGATFAAGTVSWAISSPVLGAWLDVARRRRRLIVLDQLLSVLGLVALDVLAGHAPGATLALAAVVTSVTNSFSIGSFSSALVEVAGEELLDRASAIEATSLNLSYVIGPALAGLLAGLIGAGDAILAQAALTLLAAGLIAVNPVFEARPEGRRPRAREALRQGLRGIAANPMLVRVGAATVLAEFGWGLMAVGFPLYAARTLHAGAHAAGYLWAGLATGSVLGTFLIPGAASLRRAGLSYAAVGLSALLWLLAGVLAAGIALVTITGLVEGPAFSSMIALRQRHAPAAHRAGVLSTVSAAMLVSTSAGSAVAGLADQPVALTLTFTAVNLAAGSIAGAGARRDPGGR
jgi:MFS family permease